LDSIHGENIVELSWKYFSMIYRWWALTTYHVILHRVCTVHVYEFYDGYSGVHCYTYSPDVVWIVSKPYPNIWLFL
jgi:hypothetical protein